MTEAPDLDRRLREASAEELARLVAARRDELGVAEARQIARNPFVTGEILESLAGVPALASLHEVRRTLAAHPRTPRPLALRLVSGLYWRELAALGVESAAHPTVRRAADRRLLERLPGLAIGERCALARRCSGAVIAALRRDPQPRVIAALLENPRLTELLLLPLASSERAPAPCLAVLADSARWASRQPLRAALCGNPATPLAAALRLLPGLARERLSAVAHDGRLAARLRTRARELLAAGSVGSR